MAIIAISRGSYSGGHALAECVARRLNYPCLSREMMLESAVGRDVAVDKLIAALEEPPSFWLRLARERKHYLNYVQNALCEAAVDGNLVYHGHAGHLVLPRDITHVIRVRIVADMEFRIHGVLRQQNLSRKNAIDYIKKVDRSRVLWTRLLYGVEWGDPTLYDVVLNLSRISMPDACTALVEMTEWDNLKPTVQSQMALWNTTLGSRVWVALANNPETSAADLEVVADDGIIAILGTTNYHRVFEAIPAVAAQVQGVREVRNQVRETSKTYP